MHSLKTFSFALIVFFTAVSLRASELMIDDFNKGYPPNALGGDVFSFGHMKTDSTSKAFLIRENDPTSGVPGRAYHIDFDVKPGGDAGWGLTCMGQDVSAYSLLTFFIKGKADRDDIRLVFKDKNYVEEEIDLSKFIHLSNKWQSVVIPLRAFPNLDFTSLDRFYFKFTENQGKGYIVVDNFALRTDPEQPVSGQVSIDSELSGDLSHIVKVDRAVIDNFEISAKSDGYKVETSPEAELKLFSSATAFEGKQSMALSYRFQTPEKVYVKAVSNLSRKLNWNNAGQITLWVKGDGSGNIFKFSVVDNTGETWSYSNPVILKGTEWKLLAMPVSQFVLDRSSKINDEIFERDEIQSYAFEIHNRRNAEQMEGTIFIDKLLILGQGIDLNGAVPRWKPKQEPAVPK